MSKHESTSYIIYMHIFCHVLYTVYGNQYTWFSVNFQYNNFIVAKMLCLRPRGFAVAYSAIPSGKHYNCRDPHRIAGPRAPSPHDPPLDTMAEHNTRQGNLETAWRGLRSPTGHCNGCQWWNDQALEMIRAMDNANDDEVVTPCEWLCKYLRLRLVAFAISVVVGQVFICTVEK